MGILVKENVMNTHKTLIVGLDDFISNLIKNHK